MNRHSTLVSYVHQLLWLLTGNLGKQGAQYIAAPLVNFTGGESKRTSPVVGARIVAGLVPCNVIVEEILTDHPARYRAMIVDGANPAHSLADSKRFREAMRALHTSVVIDVALTETAREADYVLPAATLFEKAEATFFNFEFPHNVFHLRPAILDPAPGTLPEAEIHTRLVEALGGYTDDDLAPLHEAAAAGPEAYAAAFFERVIPNPKLAGLAPAIAYRTLGPTLPAAYKEGVVVWALAARFAMQFGPSLARAGFTGPPPVQAGKLFQALLDNPTGVVFAADEWDEVLRRVSTPDRKVQLALPDLLDELRTLEAERIAFDPDFPFVLSAGERRSFTANTMIRPPEWRKKDACGALRLSPGDAAALGLASGDAARLTTRRGSAVVRVEVNERMQPGHLALPNGTGLGAGPDPDGLGGVAPNELTALEDRDRFVGTPWHKIVPARLESV
jgi:anaerobic selenocysteine-containing dehydrogenase